MWSIYILMIANWKKIWKLVNPHTVYKHIMNNSPPRAKSILFFMATVTADICSTAFPTTGRTITPTNAWPSPNWTQNPSILPTNHSDNIVTMHVSSTMPNNAQLNGINATGRPSSSSSAVNRCTCVDSWKYNNLQYSSINSTAHDLEIRKSSTASVPKDCGINNVSPATPSMAMNATAPWDMNFCSGWYIPPQKKHMPSTSSKLENTEPIKLDCTTR